MIVQSGSDPAADEVLVIAKICSCMGCFRRADLDQPASYAFTYTKSKNSKEVLFFIPHPLSNGYYTVNQIAEIEGCLNGFEIDLLPLDWNIMH